MRWPDLELGAGRKIVTDVADTVTNRADRLPRPTVADDWPHLYDNQLDTDHLMAEMQNIIADPTEEERKYKPEKGATVTNLTDRMQSAFDITRQELFKGLEILEERGEVRETECGLKQLQ